VQDVDRVAHIQALPEPTRRGGVRVQDEPRGIVPRSQKVHRLIRNLRRWRDVQQNPPVRAAKLKLAVWHSLDLVALLMDGAVMAAA